MTFSELSVKVVFPVAGGTSFTLYLLLSTPRSGGTDQRLPGTGWAQVVIPASIVVTTTATSESAALSSLDGNWRDPQRNYGR